MKIRNLRRAWLPEGNGHYMKQILVVDAQPSHGSGCRCLSADPMHHGGADVGQRGGLLVHIHRCVFGCQSVGLHVRVAGWEQAVDEVAQDSCRRRRCRGGIPRNGSGHRLSGHGGVSPSRGERHRVISTGGACWDSVRRLRCDEVCLPANRREGWCCWAWSGPTLTSTTSTSAPVLQRLISQGGLVARQPGHRRQPGRLWASRSKPRRDSDRPAMSGPAVRPQPPLT